MVEEVDPTGAGDCFGGAYVACRRLGMPAAKALDYANAAGARNVTRRGPMEGAGTRAELDDFIAATPRRAAMIAVCCTTWRRPGAARQPRGITSVCSAHPIVIRAAARNAARSCRRRC